MRVVAVLLCAAAFGAPAALAKGKLSIVLANRQPHVRQAFTVTVRTSWRVPPGDWLRLIAVAPGKGWFDVVGTVTGDSSRAHAVIPRDGFEIPLKRVAPTAWRAVVRLPAPGRWRLVVPNGTHLGFLLPPPDAWMP